MKRKMRLVGIVILAILTLISVVKLSVVDVSARESKIGFYINNTIVETKADMGEPFLANSRTFVPLRFVSENLGFKVDWEQSTRTATVHGREGEIKVSIGKKSISTPAGEMTMDVEAFLKDGRTYVPVRFVAEALGFKVDWLPATQVEGSRNYNYGFYVSILGELGNTVGQVGGADNPYNIDNKISSNPADWPLPLRDNGFQKYNYLAKNPEFIEYLLDNWNPSTFYMSGFNNMEGDLGPTFAISEKFANGAYDLNDMMVQDMRGVYEDGSENYVDIYIREYLLIEDVFKSVVLATAGAEDGKYIVDFYNKERIKAVNINQWLTAPNGTEFRITTDHIGNGVHVFIK